MIVVQQIGSGFYQSGDNLGDACWSWVSGTPATPGSVASLSGRVGVRPYLSGLVGEKAYLDGEVGAKG